MSAPNLVPVARCPPSLRIFSLTLHETPDWTPNRNLPDDLHQETGIAEECEALARSFPLKEESASRQAHDSAASHQQAACVRESAFQQSSAGARASPSSGGSAQQQDGRPLLKKQATPPHNFIEVPRSGTSYCIRENRALPEWFNQPITIGPLRQQPQRTAAQRIA
ncbi:hypothetical protein Efla_004552 [Eimeria flavescens]